MNIDEILHRVQGLLGRTLNNTQSPEEKELFRIATAALMFISETGRTHSFEDYLQLGKEDPPYAVASFKTREEAEVWLKNHPEPPHGAHVLVADEYHLVAYRREHDIRSLLKLPVIEYYLADLARGSPAAPVASFSTHEEADSWLQSQPEPPRNAFILVAGKYYVGVYHRLIDHRALYPLPIAEEPERNDDTGEQSDMS
ncbi:head protein [Archangium sp.]|uniref:head protein n=1 Tax=Archangium sp. TaxID=1872627 RepID=UPI002D3CB6D1|nr:head protein [Archangium sp.]HYO56287.1 head protein [Archangium sp.]